MSQSSALKDGPCTRSVHHIPSVYGDIPHALYNAVGIVLARARLAAGGQGQPGATMTAKHIPSQERLARDVPRNGALLFGGETAAAKIQMVKGVRVEIFSRSLRKKYDSSLDGPDSRNGHKTLIACGGKMCYTCN